MIELWHISPKKVEHVVRIRTGEEDAEAL